MKLIDEKGRLFGKINIIDFSVLVLLLFVLPMFYFSYKLVKKNLSKKIVKRIATEVTIDAKLIQVPQTILNQIAVGDSESDENGKKIAEIVSLGAPVNFKHKIDMGNAQNIIIKDQNLQEVPVKIKLSGYIENDKLYYKENPLSVKSTFDFKTGKYALKIQPNIEGSKKWVQAKVLFMGASPELSNLITKGHMERDSEGTIIGELKEVISNKTSEVSALKMEENKVVLINDPYRNDVVALLNLFCTEKEGSLYFKNYPVKIGNQINFTSDMYSITGSIIGIEYETSKDSAAN
ncbi:MAG: DUF4330 family protein [Candidatus Omnitrophica bacterium]|nr:DUF4330 family protein [Candidatus Omnitrophota bacterium]